MARLPRVVMPDVPHHVTQRGNARQVIFDSDADRLTYLGLLQQHAELYRLSLLGCSAPLQAPATKTCFVQPGVCIRETWHTPVSLSRLKNIEPLH